MWTCRSLRRSALPIAAFVAATTLASCSSESDTETTGAADAAGGSSETSQEWTFTDDTGTTVTLDQQPEVVASFSDYALGLMSLDVEPAAIFGRVDVASDPRFADYDLSETAIVGNSYGEIDLEALAETAPELIVTGIYPTDREGTLDLEGPDYGVADVEQQEQLEAIAPVVTIEVGGAGSDVIDSLNRLALALGAEQSSVDEAKTAFDAAAADLRAATEESDLEVTQMYADASSGIYLAKPTDEPEMELYGTYGVNWTDLNPGGDYYWDIYSWENAEQMMTGDVLLVNVEGFGEDDLLKQETFASHPALQAGQVYAWNQEAMDYRSQAKHMGQLAEVFRASKPV